MWSWTTYLISLNPTSSTEIWDDLLLRFYEDQIKFVSSESSASYIVKHSVNGRTLETGTH